MPKGPGSSITNDVRAVRRSLHSLERALRRLASSVGSPQSQSGAPAPRRKLRLSPARKAALKLQGQYMGYLRSLKPKQKAEVKALREKKGIRPAIARAKRYAAA